MIYNYVTTKKGQERIEDIRKGTLVLCKGVWKPCPVPVETKCYRYEFHSLPDTIFPVKGKGVIANTNPRLQKLSDRPELSAWGYLSDKRLNSDYIYGKEDLLSWIYPELIRLYNRAVPFTIEAKRVVFQVKAMKPECIKPEDLTQKNLEYYLEGMFHRGGILGRQMRFELPVNCETDKMVLRLLGLTMVPDNRFKNRNAQVTNETMYTFLSHVSGEYGKSVITDDLIAYTLRRRIKLPKYIPVHLADLKKITETEGLTFPGLDYDVNTLNFDSF